MTSHPFGRASSAVNFVLNNLEDIIVAFLGMRNDAAGTVLDAVLERERTAAFEQVERAPAEKTGLPCFKIMAGIKSAILVGKKLVVHLGNSSLGNFTDCPG